MAKVAVEGVGTLQKEGVLWVKGWEEAGRVEAARRRGEDVGS